MTELSSSIIKIHRSKDDQFAVGAGFFITEAGHILTCQHVIDALHVKEIWVSWKGLDKLVQAEYCEEFSSPTGDMDFAILKISNNIILPPLLNIATVKCQTNDLITGQGYFKESDHTELSPAQGYILGKEGIFWKLKNAAYIDKGISGSPALHNATGNIIGVFKENFPKTYNKDSNNSEYIADIGGYIIPIDAIAKNLKCRKINNSDIALFINKIVCCYPIIIITLKLTKSEDGTFVEWNIPKITGCCEYSIDIDEKKIKRTIDALDEYLNSIEDINNIHNSIQLKNLTIEGYVLFDMLLPFSNLRRYSRDTIERIAFIRNYLIDNDNDIKIIVRSNLNIPWNCLYIDTRFDNLNPKYFFGNRYIISVENQHSRNNKTKNNSNYAVHNHNIKMIDNIKNIFIKNYDEIIFLNCMENTEVNFICENTKITISKCSSADEFCEAIRKSVPKILFICFDEDFLTERRSKKYANIKIGDLEIGTSRLKSGLSSMKAYPIFVIMIGRETKYEARIEFKKLFIDELKWSWMIFMDGKIPLEFSIEYFNNFLEKFMEEKDSGSVAEVLFKIRSENKNNIGLSFTAYRNK